MKITFDICRIFGVLRVVGYPLLRLSLELNVDEEVEKNLNPVESISGKQNGLHIISYKQPPFLHYVRGLLMQEKR